MMRERDGRIHELNRLDIKNHTPMAAETEERILAHLRELVGQVDGIIVADQVQERNCGVITDRVRATLNELGGTYPETIIAVDSRVRIGKFRNVFLKPNAFEAARAVFPEQLGERNDQTTITLDQARASGRALYRRNGRPVFVTLGADGVLIFDHSERTTHVPGIRVNGPLDIVGAGDSAMAGIVSALCCGARSVEAAYIGNLVASITIQQIGTTGTATREQVRARNAEQEDRR
jgi:bifunctional ADP-heptose synthase (sugar kinase/adenylyltransferase)